MKLHGKLLFTRREETHYDDDVDYSEKMMPEFWGVAGGGARFCLSRAHLSPSLIPTFLHLLRARCFYAADNAFSLVAPPANLPQTLTREIFESLNAPLFKRCLETVAAVLKDGGIPLDKVSTQPHTAAQPHTYTPPNNPTHRASINTNTREQLRAAKQLSRTRLHKRVESASGVILNTVFSL